MKLKDKVVLVTGGAQGIGQQICFKFATAGADIIIADINLQQAKKTKQAIKTLGCGAETVKLDVTNSSEVQSSVNNIVSEFKKIDISVNNAGITKDNLILRMSEVDWEAVLNVNLTGTFNCIKSVSRQMLKQREGKIISIASIIGITGNIGQANYAASKAGIIAITKTAAKELAPRNINVNAIAPGFIQTQMTDKLSEAMKNKMLEQIPLGRFGQPEDIANLCLFLASDSANYITGQTIVVDGGMI